jgi:hypothetical protein
MPIADTLKAIRELVRSDRVIASSHATLQIVEKGKQATLKSVNIVSVGADAFSIKYDECGFPSRKLFSDSFPLHRGCDSIAFCVVDAKPYVLCVELKSTAPTRHEVAEQFQSADCFLKYLDYLLLGYCKCESIATWERRYFVFHGDKRTPLKKEPLVELQDNTQPNLARFLAVSSGEKVYARKLLGKEL